MSKIIGQDKLVSDLDRIFKIFASSDGEVRPHFILTGESGSGKTFTISSLAKMNELGYFEINAAQLTKEGVSGNSLSKALSPVLTLPAKPSICFVDEFDKLFISGNSNDSSAHESTTGVQNEFLKVLESDTAAVFGDYGKYISVPIKNILFVFAGAFNGEENINLDRLRSIGIKTEFLGRVGLVFNTEKLKLSALFEILESSSLLEKYLALFAKISREKVLKDIKSYIEKNYQLNTLGARMINTLIHQYFISGGKLPETVVKNVTFQKQLSFS